MGPWCRAPSPSLLQDCNSLPFFLCLGSAGSLGTGAWPQGWGWGSLGLRGPQGLELGPRAGGRSPGAGLWGGGCPVGAPSHCCAELCPPLLRRWARWSQWVGCAPGRRWTGASSETSSWPGLSPSPSRVSSVLPSWRSSSSPSWRCEGTRARPAPASLLPPPLQQLGGLVPARAGGCPRLWGFLSSA